MRMQAQAEDVKGRNAATETLNSEDRGSISAFGFFSRFARGGRAASSPAMEDMKDGRPVPSPHEPEQKKGASMYQIRNPRAESRNQKEAEL
jgi:hypothetical protein